jgi:hypothetical protein
MSPKKREAKTVIIKTNAPERIEFWRIDNNDKSDLTIGSIYSKPTE